MPHRLTYLRATGRRAADALRVCRGAKNPDANTVAVILFTHASCLDSTREGALEKPLLPVKAMLNTTPTGSLHLA